MNSNNNLHKTPIATNSTTECCPNCNSTVDHPCLLHHVKHRGLFRRLCTSCVLKLHPGSFCPTCFELIDPSTPTHLRVCCMKCHSISHSGCLPGLVDGVEYTCPPCSSPSFSFFDIRKSGESNGGVKVIDKHAATALLCAARIAAVSMNKAMGFARSEAERRVREATLSKKRAREALERVASLAEKERNGSRSVPVQGKERASKINNGGDAGSAAKHNRVDTKAKVSTPIVGREPKMKFDVKRSSSSTMAGETMAMKEEKPENKSISTTDVEKGGNGNEMLPLPPPTHVEGSVPLKGTSNINNEVVENGTDGTVLSPNPVVERNFSRKEANMELDNPSNPAEEMKLTPSKENNYKRSVEVEMVDKALLPPVPAKETSTSGNLEIEKAKNGSLPTTLPGEEDKSSPPVENVANDIVEVVMADTEILPPIPVIDSRLLLQGSSANPNPALEMATNALLPPCPVQEAKVSPSKESSGNHGNAEPTEATDSLVLPPHPVDEDQAPNAATTPTQCAD